MSEEKNLGEGIGIGKGKGKGKGKLGPTHSAHVRSRALISESFEAYLSGH